MKQVHILVTGFVHGVGYRAFVRHHARKMGLTGWVRNLSDGRVEAVVQANLEDENENDKLIQKMIKFCKRGAFLSEVKEVAFEEEEPKAVYSEFKVLKP